MKKLTFLSAIFIAASIYAQVPSYVPTNGLVGWWPFNGNANDESGNGNNGTIYGATLISDRNGSINSAYDFNANAQIVCPQNNIPNQIFSLSVWINPDNYFANMEYVCLGSSASTTWGAVASNNNLCISYGAGCSGTAGGILNNTSINTGNWTHLVYVSSGIGGNTQIYKNGVLIGQVQNSTSIGGCSSQNLYFGVDIFSISEFIDGKLDDIGIWNRALTDLEIATLFEGCNLSITSQPQDQNVPTSIGTANFSVSSSNSNTTYQWQTNLGLGFQNLSNAGQYSGVTSSTLNVSNLSMTNNNQVFRCLINDGGCTDTSTIATLTIIDDASISETGFPLISISPNPTTGSFTLHGLDQLGTITSLRIMDNNGKVVQVLDPKATQFACSTLKTGVYFLEVTGVKTNDIVKLVIQ